MNEHYKAVLDDLRGRRAALELEIQELDKAITAIHRISGAFISSTAVMFPPIVIPAAGRFANISVRWAVLWHLAEFAQGFQRTGEIAQALKDGGYKTEAANFGNMVSAVLSGMKAKDEVEASDDGSGYRITDEGRKTWSLIRQGAKFRAATSAPTETPLLSVQ